MKPIIAVLFIILGHSIFAQTTAIPDANFEQTLINMEIDSDETLNGQVLTADIASVEVLNISAETPAGGIENLTGIEGFASLRVLNISDIGLYGTDLETNTLNLSSLTNLEELYMNSGGDAITLHVQHVVLSNNPNLEMIIASNVLSLLTIDLQNSDLQLNNLYLHATNYIMPGEGGVCITVSNPSQAEEGEGIYATWDTCCHISFSENCNLSTTALTKNNIQLYPNPVEKMFQVNSENDIKIIRIFNLQGKLVKQYTKPHESYPVVDLTAGLYLVEIQSIDDQKQLLKFLKK